MIVSDVNTKHTTREGRVLKACSREGKVFGYKCVLVSVGFFKECVSKGYNFWKFFGAAPIFSSIQHFELQKGSGTLMTRLYKEKTKSWDTCN